MTQHLGPRMDFPVTRAVIDELDGVVQGLAQLLPPPQLAWSEDGSHRWVFAETTAMVLLVAKAVRMVSGLRAAVLLADYGFVVECAALIRIVSDFSVEVFAVAEGELRGHRTRAQVDFVTEFFERKPRTPAEASLGSKKRYVGRSDLIKAHVRISEDAGSDEDIRALMTALNDVFDGYAHGSYASAMELYHGGSRQFMLNGHEGAEAREIHLTALAGRLHEVLYVLGMIALVAGDEVSYVTTRKLISDLSSSGEQDLRDNRV